MRAGGSRLIRSAFEGSVISSRVSVRRISLAALDGIVWVVFVCSVMGLWCRLSGYWRAILCAFLIMRIVVKWSQNAARPHSFHARIRRGSGRIVKSKVAPSMPSMASGFAGATEPASAKNRRIKSSAVGI